MTTAYEIVDLDALSLSLLVALHNAHADKPVKKFSTKPIALRRCAELADGRVVTRREQPEGCVFTFESCAEREQRLAGLSVNEAAEHDMYAESAADEAAEQASVALNHDHETDTDQDRRHRGDRHAR